MIVPMKKVTVIILENRKRQSLRALRKAGVLHISTDILKNEKGEELQKKRDVLETVAAKIHDAAMKVQDETKKGKQKSPELLEPDEFAEVHARAQFLISQERLLLEELQKYRLQRDRLSSWGDFSFQSIEQLAYDGIELTFYQISPKELKKIPTDIEYVVASREGKMMIVATVNNKLPEGISFLRLEMQRHSLTELNEMIRQHESRIDEITVEISEMAAYLPHYNHQINRTLMDIRFESVAASMDTAEHIAWVTGFLPVEKVNDFKQLAAAEAWGYAIEDPTEEDNVPTLIKNKRWVSTISPIFDIMGTVPGYREYDISMWFLMFFSLFFAMIIGDAAYGLIFLVLAVLVHRKTKKATNAVVLLYVLSSATIIWGALTGTWFGSKEVLTALPFLKVFVIPAIANYPELFGVDINSAQNMVMKFCFIIGTVQLSLACVMNIYRKVGQKNLSAMADFGWLMMIDALYFLVLMLVINAPIQIGIIATIIGIGFVFVVLFGAQGPGVSFAKGMAMGAAGLFTTFLNTISAFSNIISYIRLFAVGMASLAIAQSFNSMASGMLQGFALPAGMLVLVIGHVLNLVMGVLSVVVHGVRLNLLEFSGQLGMEWTGVTYDPFREIVERS